MPARRSLRTLFGSVLVLALGAVSACSSPGGSFYSDDRFTYVSNSWQPWTVSVIDTRTGETLWSVDVPVGQQLVIAFIKGTGPNERLPDMMQWGLMEAGRSSGSLPNLIPVPGRTARRTEPTLRPVPEMPNPDINPNG